MARLVEDGGEASGGVASEDLIHDESDSDVQVVSSNFVSAAGSVLSPGGVMPTGAVSGPQGEEAGRRLRHSRKVTPPASSGAAVTGGVSSVDVVHEVVRSTPADVSTSGRGPSIPGGSSALPRVALTESLGARGSRGQGEAQNEFQEVVRSVPADVSTSSGGAPFVA